MHRVLPSINFDRTEKLIIIEKKSPEVVVNEEDNDEASLATFERFQEK
jgi:hypothetical protein